MANMLNTCRKLDGERLAMIIIVYFLLHNCQISYKWNIKFLIPFQQKYCVKLMLILYFTILYAIIVSASCFL
jgi:hypothetical protein